MDPKPANMLDSLLENLSGQMRQDTRKILLNQIEYIKKQNSLGFTDNFLSMFTLPITRRVFPNLIAHELCSVGVLNPEEGIHRKLKAKWCETNDLIACYGLDWEVEQCAVIAQDIKLELDFEVTKDALMAAPVGKVSNVPDLLGDIRYHSKRLSTADSDQVWIVTSPEIRHTLGDTIIKFDNGRPLYGIGKIGVIPATNANPTINVYEDPYFPRNKTLVGVKGPGRIVSNFQYSTVVERTPSFLYPEGFTYRRGLMVRYLKTKANSELVRCIEAPLNLIR